MEGGGRGPGVNGVVADDGGVGRGSWSRLGRGGGGEREGKEGGGVFLRSRGGRGGWGEGGGVEGGGGRHRQ